VRRALLALALATTLAGAACERQADLRDEPLPDLLEPTPTLDAGDIPELDAGLGSDAYPACEDRPGGACVGPIDFPCAFDGWVSDTAARCQSETGCKTNGWLEVTMAADGCVSDIGMDNPNPEMVACLLEELGSIHCPCGEGVSTYYFGEGNDGMCG
jgi:hypothetical protein